MLVVYLLNLASENDIDEDVLWLHYGAVHGEILSIDGYEEDVTKKFPTF